MFISVGKMFGKGKLRFGVGIRLTKNNFWWMAFAAMFYYMFLLMWYMMLFCFWLMYAMCYGIWWCIKKIFKIGAKQVSTPRNTSNPSSARTSIVGNNNQITTNESAPADEKTAQSNYAKTVFLWGNQKPGKIKKRNEYPSYIFYECGIQDGARYYENMIKEGYLVPSTPQEKLSGLKVDELKEILSEQGLPVTGKKAELIERIASSIPSTELSSIVSEETYSLSDIGKKFLEDNNDYVLLHTHKNWGIDWKEFDSEKMKCPGKSFYDVCWGIFNKRLLGQDAQRILGRNEYLNMHQLLMEEKRYKDALDHLLRVLYIDFSGYNSNMLSLYSQGIYKKNDLKQNFQSSVMIAPGIIKGIGDLQDYYDTEMARKMTEWKLPFNACSPELYINSVESIIHGSFDEEEMMKKLKTGYNKAVDQLR